jgi:hypothetical protein
VLFLKQQLYLPQLGLELQKVQELRDIAGYQRRRLVGVP